MFNDLQKCRSDIWPAQLYPWTDDWVHTQNFSRKPVHNTCCIWQQSSFLTNRTINYYFFRWQQTTCLTYNHWNLVIFLCFWMKWIYASQYFNRLQQLKYNYVCHILFERAHVVGNGYCFDEQRNIIKDTEDYKIKFDYRPENKIDKNHLYFILF